MNYISGHWKSILEQMDLHVGPSENRSLRNVAAMMFCENPGKFFKRTQVEVVFFPEGRLANPNNLYEAPVITGSVTQIIERTLEYLNRMVVMQSIIKPKNDNHSIKFYTLSLSGIGGKYYELALSSRLSGVGACSNHC